MHYIVNNEYRINSCYILSIKLKISNKNHHRISKHKKLAKNLRKYTKLSNNSCNYSNKTK